jgi:hypothetical protein
VIRECPIANPLLGPKRLAETCVDKGRKQVLKFRANDGARP